MNISTIQSDPSANFSNMSFNGTVFTAYNPSNNSGVFDNLPTFPHDNTGVLSCNVSFHGEFRGAQINTADLVTPEMIKNALG